jgi:hypothetical protein
MVVAEAGWVAEGDPSNAKERGELKVNEWEAGD